MVIRQLEDLVLGNGLGIGKGRRDRPAMERIIVKLVQRIGDMADKNIVDRIVGARAVIDIGRGIDVERDGPVGFCEPVAELQVGAIDIKA